MSARLFSIVFLSFVEGVYCIGVDGAVKGYRKPKPAVVGQCRVGCPQELVKKADPRPQHASSDDKQEPYSPHKRKNITPVG